MEAGEPLRQRIDVGQTYLAGAHQLVERATFRKRPYLDGILVRRRVEAAGLLTEIKAVLIEIDW